MAAARAGMGRRRQRKSIMPLGVRQWQLRSITSCAGRSIRSSQPADCARCFECSAARDAWGDPGEECPACPRCPDLHGGCCVDGSCACDCSSDACALADAGSHAGSWDCSSDWTTTDAVHSIAAEPSKSLARSSPAGEMEEADSISPREPAPPPTIHDKCYRYTR